MNKSMVIQFGFKLTPIVIAAALAGCTVHPAGEREEKAMALSAGKPFEKPFQKRGTPPLPDNPTAEDLVQHALLANAELENRYWQWRSAIEQIPQDATQSTNFNIALGTIITNGRAASGMTTLAVGNDPMTDIKWPGKLDAAARIALENAKAAGLRFRKAQFDLRSRVLNAYYDYALTGELVALEVSNYQLLQTSAAITEARNGAGAASQRELLQARNEVDLSSNDILNLKAQLPAQRAALNALLSRPTDAPLSMSEPLPDGPLLRQTDAELQVIVAARNPELAALADEARGREEAIRLARLQYVPDFNLSAGADLAGVAQNILAQATVPFLRYEAIDAAIAQAQANLRAVQARRRQASNDLASQAIADVLTLRDAERQLELFNQVLLPRARQIVDLARSHYEAGHETLITVLDSQRMLIAIERLALNERVSAARRVADLEAIAAMKLSR